MKTCTLWTALAVALFLSLSAKAQVSDSIYYNRLFYTCKAWGHAKYYHSGVAGGNVNWDDALIDVLPQIKNASTNILFNDVLLQLLNSPGQMVSSSNPLPNVPDSLNNNTDYSWIENDIFSEDTKENLQTIQTLFRPQNNIYVAHSFSGSQPTFEFDDQYHDEADYPSEEKRILAVFRYWNIINYFFPYKYIMDQDWDSTLREFMTSIVEASNALEYGLAFKQMTTRINDSHAFFYTPTYRAWVGQSYTPFRTRFIEGEMVITQVLPQVTEVKVGDVIKAIDKKNIEDLRNELRPYASGSNEVIIEREINSLIMWGDNGNFDLTIENANGTKTVTLNRNGSNFNNLAIDNTPIWRDTLVNGSCHYGIVDMGRLEINQVGSMFSDLWDTDAIIFDVRNYPNSTLWTIVNYLYTNILYIANFTRPDIQYPGRLYWAPETIGSGTSNPYSGEIMILFDERTQSHAEYTCMGLEQFPNATKIGSTTSAADGNSAIIYLPGKLLTYATFLGTYYPDYTPTQRIGIIPDFEVLPTIAGMQEGRDEVMEFALACSTTVDTKDIPSEDDFTLYPNPTHDLITYDVGAQQLHQIEILDFQGRVIKQFQTESPSGDLDLSDLPNGVYAFKVYTEDYIKTKKMIKF